EKGFYSAYPLFSNQPDHRHADQNEPRLRSLKPHGERVDHDRHEKDVQDIRDDRRFKKIGKHDQHLSNDGGEPQNFPGHAAVFVVGKITASSYLKPFAEFQLRRESL
ncbi:MAG: hypothetical protein ACKVPX_02465, partial [Myxococcaceae bacterium]